MLAWGLKSLQCHFGRFESTQSITIELDPIGDFTQKHDFCCANSSLGSLFVGQEPLLLLKALPLSAVSC